MGKWTRRKPMASVSDEQVESQGEGSEDGLSSRTSIQQEVDIPDTVWHKGVMAGTGGWIVAVFGVGLLPTSLFGLIFFISWVGLPIAIYKDTDELSEYINWPKYRWAYIISSLVWIIAFIPGLVYLWRRRKLSNVELTLDIETSVTEVDETELDTTAEDIPDAEESDFEYDFNRTTIEFEGEEHSCEYVESKNGRWRAAYGKSYNTGKHRFFLQQDGELQFSTELENGQDCAVADTGGVVVIDGLDREELSGKLYVFTPSGEQRLSHFFNANVGACAITGDGSHAAVATLNPDCSTYIFELEYGDLIVEHEHLEGNKMGLTFREEDDERRLFLADGEDTDPFYAINLDGEVVWKSEELQRQERLQELMESSETDDLEEALELLHEAYEVAAGENEKKNVARKLADTHWSLAKEIKREEGDTDQWWSHLNQAKEHYFEILPWYDGKSGAAKILRKQGKYYLKQEENEAARDCFQNIADLEEEYDVQLLTDADERRLEELSAD